jgi:hypothetical protein
LNSLFPSSQIGIASAIVTVYQAEITPPAIRGRIVSIQQLAISPSSFLLLLSEVR